MQVKNLTRAYERGLDPFVRADWDLVNGSLVSIYNDMAGLAPLSLAGQPLAGQQSLNYDGLGIRGPKNAFTNVWWDGEKIRVGKKHCLTVMDCIPGTSKSTCDFVMATTPASKIHQGAFLKLALCRKKYETSQKLTLIKHTCNMDKLHTCDEEACGDVFEHLLEGRCDSPIFVSPSTSPTSTPISIRSPSTESPFSIMSTPSFTPSQSPYSMQETWEPATWEPATWQPVIQETQQPTQLKATPSPTSLTSTSPTTAPRETMTGGYDHQEQGNSGENGLSALLLLAIPIGLLFTSFVVRHHGKSLSAAT